MGRLEPLLALPKHVAIRGGAGCRPAGTEPSQTAVPRGYVFA